MADSVQWFVADLARETTSALVNQYAIEVPGMDRPGAAAIRCVNLRAYLEPRVGARLALIKTPVIGGAQGDRKDPLTKLTDGITLLHAKREAVSA